MMKMRESIKGMLFYKQNSNTHYRPLIPIISHPRIVHIYQIQLAEYLTVHQKNIFLYAYHFLTDHFKMTVEKIFVVN